MTLEHRGNWDRGLTVRRWMNPRTKPDSDCGSATIWVLASATLVLALAIATVVVSSAVLARHRAETAADLAALAAAEQIGLQSQPCSAALGVAVANSLIMRSCQLALAADGRSGSVVVALDKRVAFVGVGGRTVTAVAKAARLPS